MIITIGQDCDVVMSFDIDTHPARAVMAACCRATCSWGHGPDGTDSILCEALHDTLGLQEVWIQIMCNVQMHRGLSHQPWCLVQIVTIHRGNWSLYGMYLGISRTLLSIMFAYSQAVN
jgi:hypothetical protein